MILFLKYEIAECLEDPSKIHSEAGEGLSFATGLIYQLATLQAVVRNIERYMHSACFSIVSAFSKTHQLQFPNLNKMLEGEVVIKP